MKNELIALPVYQERVSPLMDVSSKYAIYETIDGVIQHRSDISLAASGELQRVEKLKELGVTTIICGAVSCCVADMIVEKGMRLLPMIYGSIDEIVEKYLNHTLSSDGQSTADSACRGKKRRKQCSGERRGKRGIRQKEKSK
ncbi:MAG: hypothetical protein JW807_12120 [Spirochaetes bacterium]|nr:hypothetical protein [Spirochaetota bacterium]